jgi:hypothetical protein
VAVAVGEVVPDAGVDTGAVAPGSTLAWVDVAARLTAAMAAAAIASGAVPLPDVGAAAAVGVVVTAAVTGIATAIGLGTIAELPSCGTPGVESAAGLLSDDDCAGDVVEPSSAVGDFPRGR